MGIDHPWCFKCTDALRPSAPRRPTLTLPHTCDGCVVGCQPQCATEHLHLLNPRRSWGAALGRFASVRRASCNGIPRSTPSWMNSRSCMRNIGGHYRTKRRSYTRQNSRSLTSRFFYFGLLWGGWRLAPGYIYDKAYTYWWTTIFISLCVCVCVCVCQDNVANMRLYIVL